jgi:serine protease AprX
VNAATIRFASWRWMAAGVAALLMAVGSVLALSATRQAGPAGSPAPVAGAPAGAPVNVTPALTRIAQRDPRREVEVIVQLQRGTDPARGRLTVKDLGGKVVTQLHVVNALAAEMPAGQAVRLARDPSVYAVTLNGRVSPSGDAFSLVSQLLSKIKPDQLPTSYLVSTNAYKVWDKGTGAGVGVAVLDTGIAGDLPDFRASQSDKRSRVVASAVVNPDATTATDLYGHGTHVAGLIAGNGFNRDRGDSLYGRYVGAAPQANLVSVKVSDDHGATSVLDVILGLQFAVDHKDDLGIRVVNMSLNSSVAQSYLTDPLDAAAEAAWNAGLVVVTAAGNRGADSDAVSYAPANDPYVITVGGVDDMGTNKLDDDQLADWSSRGTTQDGLTKPDVLAPGAHMVSDLAPGSDFASLCPDCVRDGQYFQVGGTSMATAVVSGVVADLLDAHPSWTPNQVKGAILHNMRNVKGVGAEIDADHAMGASWGERVSNQGLTPSTLLDPATGQIDYSRAGWSRAGWSDAVDALRAGWSRAGWSWTCACVPTADDNAAAADPTRAGWSRAGWSRAGWSRAGGSTSVTQ